MVVGLVIGILLIVAGAVRLTAPAHREPAKPGVLVP